MNNINETLIPKIGVITDVRIDTPDIKTFRVVTTDGKKAFDHRPGQCAMLSIPGVGEAMFSITSSPTEPDFVDFSIKYEKFRLRRCFHHRIKLKRDVPMKLLFASDYVNIYQLLRRLKRLLKKNH